MKFFKPDDFKERMNIGDPFERMADVANHKLEREGVDVYRTDIDPYWKPFGHNNQPTKRALLINIEPIEKCTHPEKSVNPKQDIGGIWFECACGARVKPKGFEPA